MFSVPQFQQYLNDDLIHKIEVRWVAETESTNSDLKKIPAHDLIKPLILITDFQKTGRGQYQRVWESPAGQNGLCSVAFVPKRKEGMSLLGLLTAVAIAETAEKITEKTSLIKWPNDVLIDGRKIAGILTETQFTGSNLEKVIIGFGLNINQKFENTALEEKATSLQTISGIIQNREKVLASVIETFFSYLSFWEAGNVRITEIINERLIGFERFCKVSLTNENKSLEAQVLGINADGNLGILDTNNKITWFKYEQIRLESID